MYMYAVFSSYLAGLEVGYMFHKSMLIIVVSTDRKCVCVCSLQASSEHSDAGSDLTYEERAALRQAEREKKRKQEAAAIASSASTDISKLSYEERAAIRRLERERRRQERLELANSH